jgi:hypothetical protein
MSLRGVIAAACLAVTIWVLGVPRLALADGKSSAVTNGSFDAGLEHWVLDASAKSTGRVVSSGCEDAHCLELYVPTHGRALALQTIAPLESGGRYRVMAQVHASQRHRVRLSVSDPHWKGGLCAPKPLAMFVEATGADDWQTLSAEFVVPVRDGCQETKGHRWQVEVEFESLSGARPAVLVDGVTVLPAKEAIKKKQRVTVGQTDLRCSYFRDFQNLDPCPGSPATQRAATVAKWPLDEGKGRFLGEAVAGNSGVMEGTQVRWRDGALHFSGNGKQARVRVDAGQAIDGPTFDIAVEIAPAKDWKGGCLIASQPKGATLGGFRLCYEPATQVLGIELSNGSANHEYTAFLENPLDAGAWTSVRVRGQSGVLELLVAKKSVKRFTIPGLQLHKGPYPLVIGAGVHASELGFRGRMRNVTLRSVNSQRDFTRATPLGFTARGRWPVNEGHGIVVHDTKGEHHGVVEDQVSRAKAKWRGNRLQFGGRPEAGGVVVRNAGPLYGDDFIIDFDVMLDDPDKDWGSLLVSKTGSSVKGGFIIDYTGGRSQLVIKLADGARKVEVEAKIPFKLPADIWHPVRVRFAHEELSVTVAGVQVGQFELPGFVLARAADPMLIGAYYYPPSKGVKGSLRNVALYMRDETIAEDETYDAHAPIKVAGQERKEEPCLARPLRPSMVVGSNVLVPNWLGVTCKRQIRGDARFKYEIDLPKAFELVGSGTNYVQNGKLVRNKIKKLGKIERDGETYQRYRVKLSYHSVAGGQSGFGPLFIRVDDAKLLNATTNKQMYFRESGTDASTDLGSVELRVETFPELLHAQKLHLSLAWMQLRSSMSWPEFFDNYRALGFNVVPTLASYDGLIKERTRRKFMKRARDNGFELMVLESPYHHMIVSPEARTETSDGTIQPYIDPAYRGSAFKVELDRIASHTLALEPEWFMMDIECFADGAYACLIGTSPHCSQRLAAISKASGIDTTHALTDLGTELIAYIRAAIDEDVAVGSRARMGLNATEPAVVYHGLFDFNKLYDEGAVDFVQPTLYRQSPDVMGKRVRKVRAAMPRGDIIPWMDPGTITEYPSVWIYDRVLEVFGSGSRGLAWFAYTNFEGSDFYAWVRALDAVIPVEEVIVGSAPMAAIKVEAGGVSATGLSKGAHHVLLVSDYETPTRQRKVRLVLPPGVEGTIWDLAKKVEVGRVSEGVVTFIWRPGVKRARTALYYVGPSQFKNGRVAIDSEPNPEIEAQSPL